MQDTFSYYSLPPLSVYLPGWLLAYALVMPPVHAQRIQRTNDAAFLLNVVHHEHRNDVGEQDHQDHTGGVAGIAVDLHIAGGTVDARILGGGQKLGKVIQIIAEVFVQ